MIALVEGAPLVPLVIEDVPTAGMKLVAALMNDPNPIHLDAAAVAALGLGDRPINQGPITISYLQSMIAAAAGGAGAIVSFEARFLANVFAGDCVVCTGQVASVDANGRRATILCEASVDGIAVVSAKAEVRIAQE